MWHLPRSYPSLVDANARVGRAKEHVDRLRAGPTAFVAARGKSNMFVQSAGRGVAVQDGSHTDSIPAGEALVLPPIISVLIGEAIYNLRGALDYLVFELAILDSSAVQEGTQFPVEDRQEDWRKRSGSRMKGLSDSHKAAIERLQPFNGCLWPALLRNLSNSDKHRRLTATSGQAFNAMTLSNLRISASGEIFVAIDTASAFSDNDKTQEQHADTVALYFDDPESGQRLPVIQTLDMLARSVTETIESFEPDFK